MKYFLRSRFEKELNKSVEDFLESVSFDKRLARYDIEGSIAHVKMLAKCKIINYKEMQKIIKGLKEIRREIELGKFKFTKEYEDIHMNIEMRLINKLKDTGKKLHTARSRNDQISLDMRMYVRDEINETILLLKKFMQTLVLLSKKHEKKDQELVMPGYTHLQVAEPILFSWYLMAYYHMFKRDAERLSDVKKRVNIMPLGACAIAGTAMPIDREYVAKLLNFPSVTKSSIDTVSDRDFIIEFIAALSVIMMHLSRLSEDLILWSSPQFEFIKFDDSFCTGSSSMPQKRNPDVAEVIRGKTGRVYGDLITILTIMKGLPLSYNRDMQEDKEALFDATETVKKCLAIYPEMLKTMKVNKDKMKNAVMDHFSWAADLANTLVKNGSSWRDAYSKTAEFILTCVKKGIFLSKGYDTVDKIRNKISFPIKDMDKRIKLKEEIE